MTHTKVYAFKCAHCGTVIPDIFALPWGLQDLCRICYQAAKEKRRNPVFTPIICRHAPCYPREIKGKGKGGMRCCKGCDRLSIRSHASEYCGAACELHVLPICPYAPKEDNL